MYSEEIINKRFEAYKDAHIKFVNENTESADRLLIVLWDLFVVAAGMKRALDMYVEWQESLPLAEREDVDPEGGWGWYEEMNEREIII